MQDLELCQQLLGLDSSWQVESVEIDAPSNRIDITIGFASPKKKALFKGAEQARCGNCDQPLPKSSEINRIVLRHLPLAGKRAYVRVPAPNSVSCTKSDCPCAQTWAAPGSKLTHDLEAHLMEVLNACGSIQGAARVSGLSAAEVRAFSERTGAGVGVERQQDESAEDVGEQTVINIVDTSKVPAATDPAWGRLIRAEIEPENDVVAFKMLLQKVRQAVAVRVLRGYLIKNQARHQGDLQLLRGEASGMASIIVPPKSTVGVPAIDAECWQRSIDGQINLQTRHVALNMMIERIRLSILRKPGDASRKAGTQILRQFFSKHAPKLGPELVQLTGQPAVTAVRTSVVIPADSDACWQKVINGEIQLESSTVGLKMMLERIRMSLARNPSDSNRRAGAKILRQYFIKHARSHRDDIAKLTGGASQKHQAIGALPSERDPFWQQLINGEVGLAIDDVGLKMMLERIRLAILNNPSDGQRLAGAKILKQYFTKYRARHQAQLDQLLAA
jgi:hypothetical protein